MYRTIEITPMETDWTVKCHCGNQEWERVKIEIHGAIVGGFVLFYEIDFVFQCTTCKRLVHQGIGSFDKNGNLTPENMGMSERNMENVKILQSLKKDPEINEAIRSLQVEYYGEKGAKVFS